MSDLFKEQDKLLEKGEYLPLMEEFYSIQGEGFNTGKAAYFVRIGGCDVGCHWCDVKESWDPSIHPLTETTAIIASAALSSAKSIVVTGGEPCTYNLVPLSQGLQQKGFQTFLETSGAYPITGFWHWICLSPKKTAKVIADNYSKAHELKVIVYNKSDFKWAEEHARLVNKDCMLYLQPEWSRSEEITPLIIEYVKNNPQWQISLQTHKYLRIP